MKIKADGRGRISLRQLNMPGLLENIGATPHAEYEVEPHPDGGVTINPAGQKKREGKASWHPVETLKPALIGQVIGASMASYYVLPDSDSPTGVFGTLEGYSTDENGDVIDFKMQGMEGVVVHKRKESGLRLNYFWVKY